MLKKVYVAGHSGMVGSAIVRQLKLANNVRILTATRNELDLTCKSQVEAFFAKHNPEEVYLAAAKVGGIYANNQYPAEFIHQNLLIQNNVIHAAYLSKVKKLLFLGSSCIYPRLASQPMSESALLTGHLEPTNEPYAIAKIAGIKLCESYNRQYGTDFRSVMPTNLYGPEDNFSQLNAHVIPALLARFHKATEEQLAKVIVWGSGSPKREFLHVDDMARACIFVTELEKTRYQQVTTPTQSHINVGSGEECSIAELVKIISQITGFKGEIEFDATKPDGAPRKLLDVTKITGLGWRHKFNLATGLTDAYQWYQKNYHRARDN